MGILDIFRRTKTTKIEPEVKHFDGRAKTGHSDIHHRSYRGGGSVLNLINHCSPDLRIDQSPRILLPEIRAINEAFPPYPTAADRHAEFMGRAIIIPAKDSDANPDLIAEIQEVADSFQVRTNNVVNQTPASGLHTALSLHRRCAYLDGSSFSALQANQDTGEIDTIRMYDSADWDVWTQTTGKEFLTLRLEDGTVVVPEPSDFWTDFSPEILPGKNWGIPMAYWGRLMADMFLRLLVNQRHQRDRVSSPPGFAYLNVNPEWLAKLTPAERKEMTNSMNRVRDGLKDMFSKAFGGIRSVGEQYFSTGTLPGGVGVAEHTFGADIPIMGAFGEEFDRLANLFFLPTKMPFPFIGLEGPSGGIGSRLFDVMLELLGATAEDNRQKLAPIGKKMLDMRLVSLKFNPRILDQYQIGWDAPNLSDEAVKATTRKTNREAEKIGVETFQLVQQGTSGDPDQTAQAYAMASGLEFLLEQIR